MLGVLRDHGSASRTDLMRATGLSRPTISAIVAELIGSGAIREVGKHTAGTTRGRPSQLLALTPPSGRALSVDIGHAHARAIVADAAGHIIQERVVGFDRRSPIPDTLKHARRLIAEVTAAANIGTGGTGDLADLIGVVIGLPSPIDLAAQRPAAARYRDVRLVEALGLSSYAGRVSVVNDADLGAAGEAAFGAGARFGTFVYVKISYGVGAGLILGGRLFQGQGYAGDIGHIRVVDEGEVCLCGNRGCLETVASSGALLKALQPAHDVPLGFADLVRLADSGDRGTQALLGDAGRTIGRALAPAVTTLNPEAVVVGGSLGALGGPLVHGLREALDRYCQPAAVRNLAVSVATCGEHAEVLGGAALAFDLIAH